MHLLCIIKAVVHYRWALSWLICFNACLVLASSTLAKPDVPPQDFSSERWVQRRIYRSQMDTIISLIAWQLQSTDRHYLYWSLDHKAVPTIVLPLLWFCLILLDPTNYEASITVYLYLQLLKWTTVTRIFVTDSFRWPNFKTDMSTYVCAHSDNSQLPPLTATSCTFCLLNHWFLTLRVGGYAIVSNIYPLGCNYTRSHTSKLWCTGRAC